MEDNNIHDKIEEYKKPLVENSLNRLFSSGQIKIIKKILCKQELTKSEKEVSEEMKISLSLVQQMSYSYEVVKTLPGRHLTVT